MKIKTIILSIIVFSCFNTFAQKYLYEEDFKKIDTFLINISDKVLFPLERKIKNIHIILRDKEYEVICNVDKINQSFYNYFLFNQEGIKDFEKLDLYSVLKIRLIVALDDAQTDSIEYHCRVKTKPDKKHEDLSKVTHANVFNLGDNLLSDAKKLIEGNVIGVPNSPMDQIRKQEILKRYNIDYSKLNQEPFLKELNFYLGYHRHSERFQYSSNISKTDVTNFATGMARFLAERAKAELNESFFDVMRKQMEKLPELQFFFPATYDHLYQMNANLKTLNMTVLRERFKDDVNALPNNIYHTTMNIDAYEGQNLNFIKTFNSYLTTNPNGQWVNLGLNAVLGNSTGLNPKDLFYNFVHGNGVLKNLEVTLGIEGREKERNLLNAIKLVELISNSLLSPDPERYWVSKEEVNELFTNENLFCTYIGLLLAKSEFKEYKVHFGNKSLKSIVEEQFAPGGVIGELKDLKNFIQSLYSLYGDVDNAVQALKNSDRSSVADDTYNIYKVFSGTVREVSVRLDNQKLFGTSISFSTEILDKYLNPTVDLAYNIYAKKYSFAINNFVEILGNAGKGDQFERIGQVLKAETSEQLRVISGYYAENFNKYKNEYELTRDVINKLLPKILSEEHYDRQQLIKLARSIKDAVKDLDIDKDYLHTTNEIRSLLINHLKVTNDSSIAKSLVENFLTDKKNRISLTLDDWVSLFFSSKLERHFNEVQKELEDLSILILQEKELSLLLDYLKVKSYTVIDISKIINDNNNDFKRVLPIILNKIIALEVKSLAESLLDSKHFRDYLDNTKAYQNFVQKFSKYGTLIGNVANAQNSDEVKAAIQDAVLPVGSSRIKRYANFSIGLNAFVGAFYGQAYYKENGTTKGMQSFGITAPIGVSFAFGTRNFIGKHNALGLNIQLIDLGSLVNFYYTKGDGAQLPAGTKIQLGDILAPGATVSYSLFNSPFSIMGGVQYVPNLSRMPEISTNTDFRPLTWRWHVGLAVDIPLFTIKTYTR